MTQKESEEQVHGEQRSSGEGSEIEQDPCLMGDMQLDRETCEFYRSALVMFTEAEIPFLVGGAYALQRYTGISRHTKDFDVFVKAEDAERALQVLGQGGCDTEMTFS